MFRQVLYWQNTPPQLRKKTFVKKYHIFSLLFITVSWKRAFCIKSINYQVLNKLWRPICQRIRVQQKEMKTTRFHVCHTLVTDRFIHLYRINHWTLANCFYRNGFSRQDSVKDDRNVRARVETIPNGRCQTLHFFRYRFKLVASF